MRGLGVSRQVRAFGPAPGGGAQSAGWYRVDIADENGANGKGNEIRHLRPYLQPMPPVFRDLLKLSLMMRRQGDRGAAHL